MSKGELLLAELKNAGVAGLTRSQLQQRLGWPSNQGAECSLLRPLSALKTPAQ
jgi:hypothetical protein